MGGCHVPAGIAACESRAGSGRGQRTGPKRAGGAGGEAPGERGGRGSAGRPWGAAGAAAGPGRQRPDLPSRPSRRWGRCCWARCCWG